MKAFHNDHKIKLKYLEQVRAHALADEIIKGKYWENGKGCAIGCTIHSSNHTAYEKELGIPRILAHLEDRLFEKLPNSLAKTWPERFLDSIKVGADLSLVWDKFASRLLTDPVIGMIQYAKSDEQLEVIQRVSDLYAARISGRVIKKEDFAAAAAADAAADAFAAAVTAAAVTAAAVTAAAAAVTAVTAADADADAFAASIIAQSELLIELLTEAK